MWTALFYDPVFWVALFIFSFVIGYFYWQEKKETKNKQRAKIEKLNEKINQLEKKQKKKRLNQNE